MHFPNFLPQHEKHNRYSVLLLCGESLEATGYGANIIDDLSMAGPDQAYGLWSAYPSRARVPCRPKPVILRSSRCPGPDASICGAIYCVGKHLRKQLTTLGPNLQVYSTKHPSQSLALSPPCHYIWAGVARHCTFCVNCASFDTTAAVRCASSFSVASSTMCSCSSEYSVMTCIRHSMS